MRSLVALLLLTSCEWGPAFFACGDVDEDAVHELAEDRDVLAVFNRMDFFCEPRADVGVDCRNASAEACTLRIGSAFARGRSFYADDATEGLMPLVEHEMTHWGPSDPRDPCAQHPPTCDGAPR